MGLDQGRDLFQKLLCSFRVRSDVRLGRVALLTGRAPVGYDLDERALMKDNPFTILMRSADSFFFLWSWLPFYSPEADNFVLEAPAVP